MMRFLIPVVVLSVLVGFLYVGLGKDPRAVPSPLLGKSAPIYELPLLHDPDQTLGTEKLLGQVYLINIWGTWCPGCRVEHDTLLEIASRDIVPIYGLNWKDDPADARLWLEQYGDPYEATMFDAEDRIALDWGAYGAPETYLIDQDGKVLHKHIAAMDLGVWERDFMPLINQLQVAKR